MINLKELSKIVFTCILAVLGVLVCIMFINKIKTVEYYKGYNQAYNNDFMFLKDSLGIRDSSVYISFYKAYSKNRVIDSIKFNK